jgi:uncharacterized membrane protein YphA (DoxX/SURF4 family)
MNETTRQRLAAFLFLRVLLGVIFCMQGYGKIFVFGMDNMYTSFFAGYEKELPRWLVKATAYYTSYMEWIGGMLLIAGLFTKQVLYLLAIVLVAVSFGHGLKEPIWDLSHVFPRTVLLAALLILPATWNRWSADAWLFTKRIS